MQYRDQTRPRTYELLRPVRCRRNMCVYISIAEIRQLVLKYVSRTYSRDKDADEISLSLWRVQEVFAQFWRRRCLRAIFPLAPAAGRIWRLLLQLPTALPPTRCVRIRAIASSDGWRLWLGNHHMRKGSTLTENEVFLSFRVSIARSEKKKVVKIARFYIWFSICSQKYWKSDD